MISDAGAIKFIETDHEWAESQPEAAADAIIAGTDMALGGGCDPHNSPPGCISFGALNESLQQGLAAVSDIDRALSRVLRVRFKLGQSPPHHPTRSVPGPDGGCYDRCSKPAGPETALRALLRGQPQTTVS